MNRNYRLDRIASARALLLFALPGLVLGLSCSDSKEGPSVSAESAYEEIRTLAEPVAGLSAQVAVTTLTPAASSLDAVNAEINTKHESSVKAFKDALCKMLSERTKQANDAETDRIRENAKQALRDSFILKFMQTATTTPPETQAEIADSNDIKSNAADGSPLTGSAALKEASLQTADGTLQIPPVESAGYVKYTDWLMKNDVLAGLITALTKDYDGVIQDCAPG